MKPTIETYSDSTALVAAAGDRLVSAIASTIEEHGTASIVLTGGGTGIGLLERVRERAGEIDWAKVHIYWGDERFVPSDDDERNDKQAREALLDHVDIPAVNVHSMAASDGEFGDDLDAAAGGYEQLLAETFVDPATEFDIHLLGMGGEGHVNSLFPDSAAVRETERMVVGVTDSPKPNHVDPARGSALPAGVAGGLRRGQGRRSGRCGQRRRADGCAGRRCGRQGGDGLAAGRGRGRQALTRRTRSPR